ncbi:DUF177 domain-containing protein [bacterium]|nr:DUF177 domain-containing protein [bacterium]
MQYGMKAKLSQLMGRATCEVEAPVPPGVGAEFRGPVKGQVVLTNAGATISARGHLSATAVCECSRCLLKHEVPLEVEVNEECRLAQIDEPPAPGEEEPQSIPILDADLVDLSELVRQVLAINVPPRSLCRPDCRGLCPHCGKNLNAGPCSCKAEGPDPRWAALRGLR